MDEHYKSGWSKVCSENPAETDLMPLLNIKCPSWISVVTWESSTNTSRLQYPVIFLSLQLTQHVKVRADPRLSTTTRVTPSLCEIKHHQSGSSWDPQRKRRARTASMMLLDSLRVGEEQLRVWLQTHSSRSDPGWTGWCRPAKNESWSRSEPLILPGQTLRLVQDFSNGSRTPRPLFPLRLSPWEQWCV